MLIDALLTRLYLATQPLVAAVSSIQALLPNLWVNRLRSEPGKLSFHGTASWADLARSMPRAWKGSPGKECNAWPRSPGHDTTMCQNRVYRRMLLGAPCQTTDTMEADVRTGRQEKDRNFQ